VNADSDAGKPKGMTRKWRVEYAGAVYHVINRGNYRAWVFREEGARDAFEACLYEAAERYRVAGGCLARGFGILRQ
jgi:REP element-mobilizing transposase RayT